MSKEKLKSCPFCGGKPLFIKRMTPVFGKNKDERRWSYKCRECHIWLAYNYPTRQQAISAWNKRIND